MSRISKQKIKISLIIIIAFLIALFIPKYENADVSVSYPDTQVIKGATKVGSYTKDEDGYVTSFTKATENVTVTMSDIKNGPTNGLGAMFVLDTVSGPSRNIC